MGCGQKHVRQEVVTSHVNSEKWQTYHARSIETSRRRGRSDTERSCTTMAENGNNVRSHVKIGVSEDSCFAVHDLLRSMGRFVGLRSLHLAIIGKEFCVREVHDVSVHTRRIMSKMTDGYVPLAMKSCSCKYSLVKRLPVTSNARRAWVATMCAASSCRPSSPSEGCTTE